MDTHEKKDFDPKQAPNAIGEHPAESDAHDVFWRENYARRPYVAPGEPYEDYAPAYRYGVETVRRYENKSFDEVESELAVEWIRVRGSSRLEWEKAKDPVRDAWEWVKTDIDHD